MDELFEQIFVFLPLALLVFFRFFYENGRRRRQAAKPKGDEARNAPAGGAGGRAVAPRPSESEGRRASADPVRAFIASIFGIADEPGARGPSAQSGAAANLSPSRQSAASPSRETSYGRRPFRYEDGAAPATTAPSERPFDSNPIESMVAKPLDQQSPDSKRPEAQRESGREGLSRVRALPELRRAIVMAELLGTPKALREE